MSCAIDLRMPRLFLNYHSLVEYCSKSLETCIKQQKKHKTSPSVFIWRSSMLDRCVGGTPICDQSIASFKTGAITRDIDLLNA